MIKSAQNGSVACAVFGAPLENRFRLPVYFKESAGRFVQRLIWQGNPFAIFLAVALGVVVTLNRGILEWPWQHISREILELHPPLADRNAFRSVVFIGAVLFIRASLDHGFPSAVLRAAGLAVLRMLRARFLWDCTTAAFAGTSNKAGRSDVLLPPAVAPAKPPSVLIRHGGAHGNSGQHAELLARKILCFTSH